jgi:mannose-6-phosphate isomerase-like protein (cupin superfamily)
VPRRCVHRGNRNAGGGGLHGTGGGGESEDGGGATRLSLAANHAGSSRRYADGPLVADYTVLNLKRDVEDSGERFGYAPHMEARFARKELGLEKSGISYFKLASGFRVPFGHEHSEQEEVYLLLSGSARVKLDDEILDLEPMDAVRIPTSVKRGFEAGAGGAEILAFGAPNTDNKDIEMDQEFWPEG